LDVRDILAFNERKNLGYRNSRWIVYAGVDCFVHGGYSCLTIPDAPIVSENPNA